jgi:glycosyltransferase involved in cell wall biosynthesis
MGKAGRQRVENEFSWEKSAKQLEEIYKDLLQ